ncbi:MAG: hypothetical protein LBE27_06550 [Deltaproteobacteria bacterium]|nr:hypothetical protein [Deltaproteobacteria bacterium]
MQVNSKHSLESYLKRSESILSTRENMPLSFGQSKNHKPARGKRGTNQRPKKAKPLIHNSFRGLCCQLDFGENPAEAGVFPKGAGIFGCVGERIKN